MSGSLTFLDSSALTKLVVVEPESSALRRWLSVRPGRVAAALARTEVLRAAGRVSAAHVRVAWRVLAGIDLIDLDRGLLDRAGELTPHAMRSLDAVHLAAALELGSDLGAFVTYDAQQAEVARAWGLVVVAPA